MKILFLGNRPLVAEICQKYCYTKVIDTPKGCSKKELISRICNEDFDVLVSNGCPWILPITIRLAGQIWLNVHPSYLPEYKGTSPIKEMHRGKVPYIAATCHHIDEGIDTGAIIYQERKPFKGTLDERYKASFKLEAEVFKKAIRLI